MHCQVFQTDIPESEGRDDDEFKHGENKEDTTDLRFKGWCKE